MARTKSPQPGIFAPTTNGVTHSAPAGNQRFSALEAAFDDNGGGQDNHAEGAIHFREGDHEEEDGDRERTPTTIPHPGGVPGSSSPEGTGDMFQEGSAAQAGRGREGVVADFLSQQFEYHVQMGTEPPEWIQRLAMCPVDPSQQISQVRDLLLLGDTV